MKKLLPSLLGSLLVLGLVGGAPYFRLHGVAAATGAGKNLTSATAAGDILDRIDETIILDVSTDARTNRFDTPFADNSRNPFDPFDLNKLLQVKRGQTFIVAGKVYLGGTIPPGGEPDNPSPFGPDTPGSIGAWVCRATFNYDFTEIVGGVAPHLFSTQVLQLASGDSLWSDGPEGGETTLRAVTGGVKRFSGARGEVTQQILGMNNTHLFNIRFTFKLKKN